jgi:hypothetical protein
MTSVQRYAERTRDIQDGFERHVWGEQTFVKDAGSVIKVRGTGTVDEEAVVMNNGVGMHLPKNSNTEVFLLASSSDTNLKMAHLTIPRDKQRNWKEGSNGLQHWNDKDFAFEFNAKRAHITKDKFAIGMEGVIEVIDGKVYIRADEMIVKKVLYVNEKVVTPLVEPGTKTIPGFEA